jgi:arylsulfatase
MVLLLTVDTLRADRLGAYGSPLDLTPSLDELLRDAVVFQHAYAPASYTLPSMSALLTGRYPEELGLLANISQMQGFTTLASVLRQVDFRSGAVVSNFVLRRGVGVEQGFDLFDDTLPQREANRDVPERIAPDTTDAALRVLDDLRGRQGSGMLLWVHYQDPHGPYLPPGDLRERYLEAERRAPDGRREIPVRRMPPPGGDAFAAERGLGSIPLYQYVPDQHEAAYYRAGYDGEVRFADAEIGRLLAGVAERGLLDDALVVFTADHGEGLGEDDYWFAHGELLTDPLVRVPLAIRAPGVPAATRSDPASLVDVFPTILAWLGVETPADYPGRDLLAPTAPDAEPAIYLATLRGARRPGFGLVADGRKYLVTYEGDEPRESLFLLGEEDRERSASEPERIGALRERLRGLRAGLRRPERERRQQLSDQEREHLRKLGYLVD